tara:strand:+ start:90 stop:965 length:876 start_codon:yes stop_codon:yes gene_type:complete
MLDKIKKPFFKTIPKEKGNLYIQQKVESNKSIKKNTQPVSDLRDNYLYENAYQQTTKMSGGFYQNTDVYRFNPESDINEGLGTHDSSSDDKVNKFVIKNSAGIHGKRQGNKFYKNKKGQRQSLKKDYFQLQLSQNPEVSRKESFKKAKKFVKEEIKSRQNSRFFKEKSKNTFTNQNKTNKGKINLGFIDKPIFSEGDDSMYTGDNYYQKVSSINKRRMMNIESSWKDKFAGMEKQQAKKLTKEIWNKNAVKIAGHWDSKKQFKTFIKENPNEIDKATRQNTIKGFKLIKRK